MTKDDHAQLEMAPIDLIFSQIESETNIGEISANDATVNKTSIADLVAKYGSSSATAWLEYDRYKLWKPAKPVPESSFTPVQGYMEKDSYISGEIPWSQTRQPCARQFVHWCHSQGKRPVWCCVDIYLEAVLACDEFNWCTVACVYEDVVDPAHAIELISPASKVLEGQKVVKDLKKNLGNVK